MVLLCLAAGCATKPKVAKNYYLFPPPPDEPRVQYLMSFGSEKDLGTQSKIAEFVVGEQTLTRPIWKPYGIVVRKGQVQVIDTQAANISTADLVKRKIRYLRPDGLAAMKTPINLAIDKDGTRYVTDTKRGEVLMYGKDGNFLGAMGRTENIRPCGIAVDAERLYVSDLSNHCVRIYKRATRELLFTVPKDPKDEKPGFSTFSVDDLVDLPSLASKLKQPGRAFDTWLAAQLSPATQAALAKDKGPGSDPAPLQQELLKDLNNILRRASIYEQQRFAGISLRSETQTLMSQNPQGGALERLNRLLIEDAYPREISRIQKSKLHSPTNLAVDEKGQIYAADTGGFQVQVYDAQGYHVRRLGEQGLEVGRFARPKGVGVDRDGRVYVVDAATQVVQMFDKDGKLLMFFGEPSSSGPAGMYLPAGLTVDYENVDFFQHYAAPGYKIEHLIFVTNQAGKNKVSVYGFLRKS